MYAVYWLKNYANDSGKRLIYAPNSGDDGYNISVGNLLKGINIAGSLTLNIPPTNPVWKRPIIPDGEEVSNPMQSLDQGDLITVDYIELGVPKEIWRGRVISQNWDIYRNMTVTCEGTLAYFNDILLPDYNFYWSGIVEHSWYDPDEGLGSAVFDKLKDLIPGMSDSGIGDTLNDVVQNVLPSNDFTPNTDSIADTLNKASSNADDNVDRRVTVYDYLVWVLTIYNAQLSNGRIDQRKRIKIGYIDEVFKGEDYKVNRKTTQYTIAWDEISEVLLNMFGGVMYVSNWYKDQNGEDKFDDINSYLYYYKDPIGVNDQIIQYGENLINYEYGVDHSERVSRWYVFGKTKDANGNEVLLDMSSVNNGLKYVGPNEGFEIGTISRVEYTDLTTPKELYDYAWQKFKESFFGTYTVSVDAVDLHMVDRDIAAFEPGKLVKMMISNDFYQSTINDFLLESMEIDLLAPENTKYTFQKTWTGV